MSKRFVVRHEAGADYAVWDTRRDVVFASGLSEDEAAETADRQNKEYERRIEQDC